MSFRIAVIGAGAWGRNVVRTLSDLNVLAGVADASPAGLADVQRRYPHIATTANVDDVFDSDVDAVAVATNAPSHAELACRAMLRGKHVFVEKPLALSVADAKTVAAVSERTGRKAFVGHLLLYHPAVVALRSIVASGSIGSIVHVRSRRLGPGRIRTNESVWWSFAPHDVAIVLELLGTPDGVSASATASVQPHIADFMYADFRYASGQSAHIEVCWLDPQKSSRIDVFGTAGTVGVETAGDVATLTYRPFSLSAPALTTIPIAFAPNETRTFPSADPLTAELRAFIAWCEGGPLPPTDVHRGVDVVATLAMTEAALTTSAPVRDVHEMLTAAL